MDFIINKNNFIFDSDKSNEPIKLDNLPPKKNITDNILSKNKQFNKEYVSLMPTNLYGSFDNFDFKSSHVLPAMLRKFHEAKLNNHSEVTLWGSGAPMREFLFVDDMAEAVVHALENNLPEYLYNIGTGKDITISHLYRV